MTTLLKVFRPFDKRTSRIAATAATSNIQFDTDASPRNGATQEVRVYNNGTAVTFVRFGVDSSVVAVIPTAGTGSGVAQGDIPIAPGSVEVFRTAPEILWMAAITGTNGDVYVTAGRGS